MADPTAPKAQADRARHLRQAEALDATAIDSDREALGRGPVALTALAAPGTPPHALAHFGPRIAASIARAGLLDAYRTLFAAIAIEQRDYLTLALLGVRAPVAHIAHVTKDASDPMTALRWREEFEHDLAPSTPLPHVVPSFSAPLRITGFGHFTDDGEFVPDPDVQRAILDRAELNGRPIPKLVDSEGTSRSLALDLTAILSERLDLDPSHDGISR